MHLKCFKSFLEKKKLHPLKLKLFLNLNGHFLENWMNFLCWKREMNYTKDKIVYLGELKILKFIYELCFSTPRIPHHDNWYFRIFITIIDVSPHCVQIFARLLDQFLEEIFSESFQPPPLWCHSLVPLSLIPSTEITEHSKSGRTGLRAGGGRSPCWLSSLTSPVLSPRPRQPPGVASCRDGLDVTTIISNHVSE